MSETKKKNIGRALLACVLTLMMVVATVPSSFFVAKAEAAATSEKTTDSSTVNEWQEYFTNDDLGTEYAGGVWTDKSVFNSGSDLDDALAEGNAGEGPAGIVTEKDNFLVAMSALATNKEIVGYSTVPTDTIIILDLSQSMDNSGSIPKMISEANTAIKRLLELNKNNRIGVVLYSGKETTGSAATGTGQVLLELDRYTAGNNGAYIKYSGSKKDTEVSIANNLKYEKNGNKVDTKGKEKQTIGGTYIQNGLYIAMNEFLAADTIIEENNVQSGESRMPIFVLMSDGAPTHATTAYTGIGKSDMGSGNGSTATAGTGFVTQLTAAYAREKVEDHYDTDARFYTLGLNLSETTGQTVARSVLNPSQSLNAINTYWDELFSKGKVSFTAHNTSGNQKTFTISRPAKKENGETIYTDMLERDDQHYVDKYFDADSNDALEKAFGEIVAEIILQSAYHPTHIESKGRDLSGYISFYDEIGHHMEVKEIEGILLGDKLFTGKAIAGMMADGGFGNRDTFTEKGWELVASVSERIGVSEDVAIELLMHAWADKQLHYEDDNNYSNYIGWYETAEGGYVTAWSRQDQEADIQAAKNSGAKYISKSYCYYGDVKDESGIAGSDMMHIVIKVRTDIESGDQEVVFQIPASLIPVITYNITLSANNYEDAQGKPIKMAVDDATPIRLLFEVGLRDEINELTVSEEMGREGAHAHPVKVNGIETGEYYFYTNVWSHDEDPSNLDPTKHEAAESEFTPSLENERYYYTEDSMVYVKSGDEYTPYRGTAAPAGENYYRAYRTFKLTGETETAAEMVYVYEKVSSETLNPNNLMKGDDNQWYIKKNTVRKSLDSYHIEKLPKESTGGLTGTLNYSRYAVVQASNDVEEYTIYSYLGNNGRIKLTPATGIKLTKKVDDTLSSEKGPYQFKIKIKNNSINKATLVTAAGIEEIAFADNTATIEAAAGETVYITGLPEGDYTIGEIVSEGAGYKVERVTVDGIAEDGFNVDDTIENNKLDDVVFTNTEANDGSLIIRKNVVNDYPEAAEELAEKEFNISVELTDSKGRVLANQTFQTSQGEKNSNSDGMIEFKLKHNESITIENLSDKTKYIVAETDLPDGFHLDTKEEDLKGSITAKSASVVTVVNGYTPIWDPDEENVSIEVKKSIKEREWEDNDRFTFRLEKLNDDGTWTAIGETQAATKADPNMTFQIDRSLLGSVGTHRFRVIETNANSIPGLISDATRYFDVTVAETDGDGYLEIESITGGNITVNSDKTTVAMEFINTYTTTGEAVVSIPVEKHMINDTNVVVPLDGFKFRLSQGGNVVDINGAAEGTDIESNAAGEAVIHLTYSYNNSQFEELDKADGNNDNTATLSYTLSEVTPEDENRLSNISYDENTYDIVVILTSDEGRLKASARIKDGEEVKDKAIFTNTFDITGKAVAEFSMIAKKELKGRVLKAGEFNFNLYNTGANFVITPDTVIAASGTNDENGNIIFDAVAGNGAIDPMKFDRAGTYYYVAKEAVPSDKKGVTYSEQEYYVTITVTYDNTNHDLDATYAVVMPGQGVIDNDNVVFKNIYNVTPTAIELSGTKKLSGRNLNHGDFTFVVFEGEEEVVRTVNTAGVAGENGDAQSTFVFPEIKYTEAGTHEYIIKELNEDKAGYSYDDTQYTVKVVVTDNGDGTLTATPTYVQGPVVFNNTYAPRETTIGFTASKELENRDLVSGEFKFSVYSADENFNEIDVIASGTNKANGDIDFDADAEKNGIDPITITSAGTYYYVIKEEIPKPADKEYDHDVVYDATEYHVTALIYDLNGRLSSHITYKMNGEEVRQVVFSNVYFEPKEAVLDLNVKKELTGRDLERNEFDFELYSAEYEQYMADDIDAAIDPENLIQRVKNGEDADKPAGTVTFDQLVFEIGDLIGNDKGTFYYIIREVAPENGEKDGVTYDDSYFKVAVTVSNNLQGELVAAAEIDEVDGSDADTADENADAAVFKNIYTESTPEPGTTPDSDDPKQDGHDPTGSAGEGDVFTGDGFSVIPIAAIAVAALIIAAIVLFRRKK